MGSAKAGPRGLPPRQGRGRHRSQAGAGASVPGKRGGFKEEQPGGSGLPSADKIFAFARHGRRLPRSLGCELLRRGEAGAGDARGRPAAPTPSVPHSPAPRCAGRAAEPRLAATWGPWARGGRTGESARAGGCGAGGQEAAAGPAFTLPSAGLAAGRSEPGGRDGALPGGASAPGEPAGVAEVPEGSPPRPPGAALPLGRFWGASPTGVRRAGRGVAPTLFGAVNFAFVRCSVPARMARPKISPAKTRASPPPRPEHPLP